MDKMRGWFVVFVLFLHSLTSPLFAENMVEFDKGWAFSWVFKADTIEFTIRAPTIGWLSLGFAPQKGMKGINTPGQALERGGVASFSAPRGGVSHLAFPALAR
ncbi:MAG: hypothetical protein WBI82_09355 [Sphaerochaeta sp.]